MVPVLAGTCLPQFLFGPSTVQYCNLLKVKTDICRFMVPVPVCQNETIIESIRSSIENHNSALLQTLAMHSSGHDE